MTMVTLQRKQLAHDCIDSVIRNKYRKWCRFREAVASSWPLVPPVSCQKTFRKVQNQEEGLGNLLSQIIDTLICKGGGANQEESSPQRPYPRIPVRAPLEYGTTHISNYVFEHNLRCVWYCTVRGLAIQSSTPAAETMAMEVGGQVQCD